jgi:hypothetical protein
MDGWMDHARFDLEMPERRSNLHWSQLAIAWSDQIILDMLHAKLNEGSSSRASCVEIMVCWMLLLPSAFVPMLMERFNRSDRSGITSAPTHEVLCVFNIHQLEQQIDQSACNQTQSRNTRID